MNDTSPPRRLPNDNATPTFERAVANYPARRRYKPYIQTPPRIEGVKGMIDIHCHAEYGQQDAVAVAKLASANGMYGIVYKSIGKEDKRSAGPMRMSEIFLKSSTAGRKRPGLRRSRPGAAMRSHVTASRRAGRRWRLR